MATPTFSERARTLRRKLDDLARHDLKRTLFGASMLGGHDYVCQAPLTVPQLSALEANYGVDLPAELRILLGEVLGGGAGPGYGLSVAPDPARLTRRSRPFPFTAADAQRVIDARLGGSERWASLDMPDDDELNDGDDWPAGPGFVPVAHHGCGVMDVVVTVGSQRGLVWCCDMVWCPVFDRRGRQLGVLDWYEAWLDDGLAQLPDPPP